MNVLGISEGFHDAGVCLLVNKRIHFASHSERHSRIKNDRWSHSNQYPKVPERKPHVVAYYEKPYCKNRPRGHTISIFHITSAMLQQGTTLHRLMIATFW